MKRVLCLYRVSSAQQVKGDDIPLQRVENRAFIEKKSKEGWVFYGEKLEKGISGYKNKVSDRDILLEILEMAERHEFDILLTYFSDRIGRREDETPFYVARLNQLGIEVWSVNEGQLKTEEHVDKLITYIRFWQAEGESRKTGVRVRDAQAELIRQGKYAGGRVPYGYRLEFTGEIDKKGRALRRLVIDREQAAVVYEIFHYVYSCDYGARRIARALNERKILSPGGNTWNISTIGGILKNPIYSGRIAYSKFQANGNRGRQAKDQWILSEEINPEWVIVPEEMFNKVQKIIETHQPHQSHQSPVQESARTAHTAGGKLLLSGIIYCGYCKGRLSNGSGYYYWSTKDGVRHKKSVPRYKCVNAATGKMECHSADTYVAGKIEKVVIDKIAVYLRHLPASDVKQELEERQRTAARRRKSSEDTYNRRKAKLQSDITVMQDKIPDILRGDIALSLSMVTELIADKKNQLMALESEYREGLSCLEEKEGGAYGPDGVSTVISDWDTRFVTAPPDIQKTIIHRIVDRVEVRRDGLTIKLKIDVNDFSGGKTSAGDRSS